MVLASTTAAVAAAAVAGAAGAAAAPCLEMTVRSTCRSSSL